MLTAFLVGVAFSAIAILVVVRLGRDPDAARVSADRWALHYSTAGMRGALPDGLRATVLAAIAAVPV
jgi:hypothetical protein